MPVRQVDPNHLQTIITNYCSTLTSGATLIHPNFYPKEFKDLNINQRNLNTNDYIGMIVTRPTLSSIVFGFSYFDKKELKDNEDIYVVNIPKQEIEFFPKGEYEKNNPLYIGTHKGLKDFLRQGVQTI